MCLNGSTQFLPLTILLNLYSFSTYYTPLYTGFILDIFWTVFKAVYFNLTVAFKDFIYVQAIIGDPHIYRSV